MKESKTASFKIADTELGQGGHHVKFSPSISDQDGVVMDENEYKTQRSNRDESNLDVEFNDRKFSAASVDVLIGTLFNKNFNNFELPNASIGHISTNRPPVQHSHVGWITGAFP